MWEKRDTDAVAECHGDTGARHDGRSLVRRRSAHGLRGLCHPETRALGGDLGERTDSLARLPSLDTTWASRAAGSGEAGEVERARAKAAPRWGWVGAPRTLRRWNRAPGVIAVL